MNRQRNRIGLASLVMAAMILSACVLADKPPVKQISLESASLLESGDYQKAIDVFKEPYAGNPGDKHLESAYAQTIEEIHRSADRAFTRRDYALAENLYGLLLKNFPDFGPLEAQLSITKDSLEEKRKQCRFASGDLRYRRHMTNGNYVTALDSYTSLLKEYPKDKDLIAKYVQAGDEIKVVADRALANKDFALAGKALSALQNKFTTFTGLQPKTTFTHEDLEKGLTVCRSTLRNRGFAEYRKGDLEGAIAVWESLLAFDPDNAEIRKAVETAKTQIKKLKK